MPKFDPAILPAIPAVRETRTFTTASGQEFSLTAQVQQGGDFNFALLDKHQSNLEHYQDGIPVGPGEANITITTTQCWLITRILMCVVPGEGEDETDLWSFPKWAMLLRRDETCFSAISGWIGDLINPPKSEEAADPTVASLQDSEGGADTSSQPLSTPQDDTPTSTHETTTTTDPSSPA